MTPPSPSGAPTPQATESLTVAAPNIPAASVHLAERIAEEQRAYLHAFDTLMAEFFTRQRELLEGISAETLPLLEAIESLSTGGKRLRALLSYWGWRGAGGAPVTEDRASWSIVKAGMAVELFQTSALIHDDIIDRSDTRRGAPSVHKRFEAVHEQNSWHGDAFNYGLTGGILAGDLTLAWSAEVFASLGEGAIYGAPARTIFDRMRTEVLAGQYLGGSAACPERDSFQVRQVLVRTPLHDWWRSGSAGYRTGERRRCRERAAPGTCRLPRVRSAAG